MAIPASYLGPVGGRASESATHEISVGNTQCELKKERIVCLAFLQLCRTKFGKISSTGETFSEARAASSNVFTDTPFAHLYDAEIFVNARKALAVKYALALVCPLWRSLSRRFLLEEIWIDGHGVESLEDLLERDDGLDGNRLGSLVRCARIQVWNPRSMPVYVSLRTGHNFALCPRIRFLIIWRCFTALPHRKRFAPCRIDIAFRDVKMPKLVYAQLRGCDFSLARHFGPRLRRTIFLPPDFIIEGEDILGYQNIGGEDPKPRLRLLKLVVLKPYGFGLAHPRQAYSSYPTNFRRRWLAARKGLHYISTLPRDWR